ncbi:MAG: YdbL family protein [Deltaproteobacteria bacterium]|nr:YdbL family protein [Deltaproteobacteria bacterium]
MGRQTRFSKLLRSSAVLFSALVAFGVQAASAATLDGAKQAGQLGESVDGYVNLVDKNAPADVVALMKDVNDKRRAKYEGIAKKRGAPLEDVAALAGAKLVERAPAGQYVLDSSGNWLKK